MKYKINGFDNAFENKNLMNLMPRSVVLKEANLESWVVSQPNHSKRRITIVLRIDTPKHVSNESKMQNLYVVRRIKSVFSKLALLLRVWQRSLFTVQKKNSPFITQVISFLNLKHVIESGGVSVIVNLFFYVFKGKQLK